MRTPKQFFKSYFLALANIVTIMLAGLVAPQLISQPDSILFSIGVVIVMVVPMVLYVLNAGWISRLIQHLTPKQEEPPVQVIRSNRKKEKTQ